MIIKHWGQHNEDCFACRIKSVSFASSAMPTRRPQAADINAAEKRLTKDRDAFKAMREQGIQPARLKGASDLQDRASTKDEIETGRLLPKSLAKKVESTKKELAQ
jgi:hypothetical protein